MEAAVARTAPRNGAARQRFILLDGLRGIAALAIIVHHFTLDAGHGELFASASIAVDFFFCLSGFVIAHAYHDRLVSGMSLGDYATRRLVRLYPMYALGTLLGLAAMAALRSRGLTDMSYEAIAQAGLLNILYIPYLGDNGVQVFSEHLRNVIFPLDNPAWSLFFGLFANFAYASCVRLDTRATVAILLAAAVGLYVSALVFGGSPGWGRDNFIGGFPRVLFSFFAGVVIYQYRGVWKVPSLGPSAVVGIFLFLAIVPSFPGHKYYWLAAVLLVMPVLVASASRCVIAEGGRLHRLCAFSGRISYPVFCIHYPLLMIFSLLPWNEPRLTLFSVGFLKFVGLSAAFFFTTVLLSYLLAEFFERPVHAALGRNRA